MDNTEAGSGPNKEIAGYEQAKTTVLREMDELMQSLPDSEKPLVILHYMNNFHFLLPGGNPEDEVYLKKIFDSPVGEKLRQDALQAVADSEKAAAANGKPINISSLNQKFGMNPTPLNQIVLYNAAFDTFVRLRAMGYGRNDLKR
ncbi:MAG: hypothetical protein M1142_01860 [Patescibacteria group bacterium]|nr:hypothetical protein [Patescibacteria group bacterium]